MLTTPFRTMYRVGGLPAAPLLTARGFRSAAQAHCSSSWKQTEAGVYSEALPIKANVRNAHT